MRSFETSSGKPFAGKRAPTGSGHRCAAGFLGPFGCAEGEGPCLDQSVTDDPALPLNDPAPDLLQATPDGKYMAVAFRGPAPVTFKHTAQGSCPGVGIVALEAEGSRGRLVTVLRTTNSLGDADASAPGGHAYTEIERSDVHGASIILKHPDSRQRSPR
ncbi:MAG: hypothetical protein ACPGVZ_17860 [Myxococcota bacterium]